jgi:hypothetical protein
VGWSRGNIRRGTDQVKLEQRVKRDQENGVKVRATARESLASASRSSAGSGEERGSEEFIRSRQAYRNGHYESLRAIESTGFQAMTEAIAEVAVGKRDSRSVASLWYANTNSTSNEVLGEINVVSWTHPGFQIALTADLGEEEDVPALGYSLLSVKPVARAKFSKIEPSISGLYEPGGAVGVREIQPASKGLRAVKLDMTKAQVDAFISRMSGLMIVTGAPGSGKTTVALQRVRFLYDQQGLRTGSNLVSYSPELTKIFLANTNLIGYTRELLAGELKIPQGVVEFVPRFLRDYIGLVWREKGGARPRSRKVQQIEEKARQAVFGLATASDLRACWREYEEQISVRLQKAENASWNSSIPKRLNETRQLAEDLSRALADAGATAQFSREPLASKLRMDGLFRSVRNPYETLRMSLQGQLRDRFDVGFAQWLYWAYDPLVVLENYFWKKSSEAKLRMRQGTGVRADEADTLEAMKKDWAARLYGSEEIPWLAWLLRFVLPEEADPRLRFRGVSLAVPMDEGRWTHVVIDEAQDLSATEASLLGSFVHPEGALTVAADYRQVVSPVHGTSDSDALKFGCALHDKSGVMFYPFARNMRQSREIGAFLKGFYEAAFGESATFEVSDRFHDAVPRVIVCPRGEFAFRIRQLTAAFAASQRVSSCALIQINEDSEEMQRLRESLKNERVQLAENWKAFGPERKLITSSVERVKGLEYDACVVLGLERVLRSSLNFVVNRAYVSLSRPCRRLVMICEEYPEILRGVDKGLFEVWESRA